MPSSSRDRLVRRAQSARVVAGVLSRTAVDTIGSALDRATGGPRQSAGDGAVAVDLPAPTGTEAYARTVSSQRLVAAPPAAVAELVRDLDRTADWLTLHVAWRGERPAHIEPGAEFVQQISLMDIPAQARWHVERADETGYALRGTGPMGITVGLWCSIAPHTGGAAVRLDGALDGAPVRGPIGLTAVRSVETALQESLAALAALLEGGAATLRVPDEPVLHERTGTLLDPTTPVVIGVGQVVQRTPDLDAPLEPAALAAEALRRAATDAGGSVDLLAAADVVYAVPSASWAYRDQAGAVAGLVGAADAATVQTSQYGGDGAQLALNDAAQQVVDGSAHVVLVSGAEAGATVAALQRAGRDPEWTQQADGTAPDREIGIDRPANSEVETSVGLGAPIYVYALIESALRGATGEPAEEHQQHIADLWARGSEIAADNPYAWDPTARSAEEIATPTPDNRRVSDPYTKLMCANLQVDLAAGVVVASVAAAQAAGVPQDRWVFLHAGASATDEWFVSERADLAESPAIAAAASAVLGHAGITAHDLGPIDLYSCFPAAVQLGAKALGLPWADPTRPLTVTGGLTAAGGPGNNYGLHAVSTIVPLLRESPEEIGLSSSLGWYATKHALGVYSATPPSRPFAHLKPAFERPPARRALATLDGPAVVEAVTVPFGRTGDPEAVVVSAITPSGDRVLLRREDPDDVVLLTQTDPLRRTIRLDGDRLVLDAGDPAELPAPPPATVRTDRPGENGEILVITLDRPAVRNAVDRAMALALERAVDDAEADASVRVIVLTGAGGTFCAGMDLSGAHRGEIPVTDRRGPLGLTAEPPTKPTIAAVEGPALAGGFELVLCADLVVAADDAVFGLPEAKRGLLAAAGGLWRTAVRLPRPVAMELALVADPLPARRLAELGLVNTVVEPGGALAAALATAARIAANAPLSIAVGKQIVDAAPTWSPEDGFARQSELASPVILSDDAREGVAAFAEKRPPRWSGH
ncbi:MAG: crotonase/enoyl-CoA hydratase family protein [Aeromicrobium sp.]|uniref:type II toxin-antitoxin system Rv0910 family toxin n=1 Tax=Aeromicrobium sp. TaxID=1871063 RepID=UPI0026156F8E|nr:crotonase/enoyl-CoA hydratase family protein [Aeromicrobium sp.]MDF1705674.1 crotonase/enoyl-CoA hydratase family protein [Aeromicrobium sp.]